MQLVNEVNKDAKVAEEQHRMAEIIADNTNVDEYIIKWRETDLTGENPNRLSRKSKLKIEDLWYSIDLSILKSFANMI
ncbi:MAG: hypothetical protein P8X90_07445 [Desulfobacterales bacterium]